MHARSLRRFERQALSRWLAASPANARDFLRTEAAWRLSGALSNEPEVQVDLERLRRYASIRQEREPRARWARWTLPAALSLATVAFLWHATQPARQWYETERGEQRTLALDDGSVVAVNSGSRLGVDIGPDERRATLDRGEAFFEVAPDPKRPFTVAVGRGWARAVGTRFNVLVQAGVVTITVLEGAVDVAPIATQPRNVVRVRAGYSVAIRADGQMERPADEQASADRILGWREGKLHFDAWPLALAVAEHNRYARKSIQLDSSVPADVRVSGVFRIGDTQAFLAALHSLMAVQVVDTGPVLRASVAPPVHEDPSPSGVRQDDP